jgi:hypothetical protein
LLPRHGLPLSQAKASLQYCAAFEAEDEEDAFDLVAAGEGQQEASAQRLQKNMQVRGSSAVNCVLCVG